MAIPVCRRAISERWGESCTKQLCIHLGHLAIQVTTHNDFRCCVLPDYALDQGDDGVCPLAHETLKARFQVDIQDVDLLSTQRYLGPVEVGAQGFHLPVVLEVAEGDAPPGSLQQGLVADEPPRKSMEVSLVSLNITISGRCSLIIQSKYLYLF